MLNVIARSAYSTRGMIQKSYELAIDICARGLEGAIVECGVAAGSQIGAMALACKERGDYSREIVLYDSFQGIPLAGKYDVYQPGVGLITHNTDVDSRELLVSSGITVHSLESVQHNFHAWGLSQMNVKYVKGWFQDTVPNCKIEKIAILRLDGDLYESTKVCLEHLADRVVTGGFIIIDDYHLPGAFKATNDYLLGKNVTIERMPYGVDAVVTDDDLTPIYWKV